MDVSVADVVVNNSLLYNFKLVISNLKIVAIVGLSTCSKLHSLAHVIKSKGDLLFLGINEIEF